MRDGEEGTKLTKVHTMYHFGVLHGLTCNPRRTLKNHMGKSVHGERKEIRVEKEMKREHIGRGNTREIPY